MKNKKIVYVENKDDLVELLNNEVEKSPSNKCMPIILMILLSMAIIAAGYFGFRLWRYYQDYQDDQKLYGDLREAVLQINDEPELSTEEIQSTEKLMSESSVKKQRIKKKKDQLSFEVNWEEMEEINKDIIGWVYFTGLPQISYPILQAEDNAYYVNRTYDLSSDTAWHPIFHHRIQSSMDIMSETDPCCQIWCNSRTRFCMMRNRISGY